MRRYNVVICRPGSDVNGRDGFADCARIDERFVALHVDDDVAIERRDDLGQSIRAGRMIRARQAHFAAEPGDCRRNA